MSAAQDLAQLRYHAGKYLTAKREGNGGVSGAWHRDHPKRKQFIDYIRKHEITPPFSRGLFSWSEKNLDASWVENFVRSYLITPIERLGEWWYRWTDLQRWWVVNRTNNRGNVAERDALVNAAADLDAWQWFWDVGGEAALREMYKTQNKAILKSVATFGAGVVKSVATGDPTVAIGTIGTIGAEARDIREARERASEETAVPVNQQLRAQVERTIRALIQIESGGRADAVSPSGNHFGILQIGEATAKDVGFTARDALNPQTAVRIFMLSMQRSADLHRWNPMLMAFRWKAGSGTLREFLQKAETMGKAAALRNVATTGSSWRSAIPEYLTRFVRAWNE